MHFILVMHHIHVVEKCEEARCSQPWTAIGKALINFLHCIVVTADFNVNFPAI